MTRSSIRLTVAAILMGMGAVSSATAQEFPGFGVAQIGAANAEFDRQFDQWNRYMSWQVALATPNDQPLPFNAMTIAQSNREAQDVMIGYIHNTQINSNRALGAVERWDVGAVQGNWYYQPQYGGSYDPNFVLPYGPGSYYEQNGYIYQGNQPGGNNLYPMYQR